MRIVDWSSGVGSSVLTVTELFTTRPMQQPRPWPRAILPGLPAQDAFTVGYGGMAQEQHPFLPFEPRVELQPAPAEQQPRSEEHTSELQSLMRISYAVFCLKQKKTTKNDNTNDHVT